MYRGKWGKGHGPQRGGCSMNTDNWFLSRKLWGTLWVASTAPFFLEDAHSRIGSGRSRKAWVCQIHLPTRSRTAALAKWRGRHLEQSREEKPRRRCPPRVQHLQLFGELPLPASTPFRIWLALSPRSLSSTTLPSLPDLSNPFLPPFPINLAVSLLLYWGGADESAWVVFYVFIYLFILPVFPQKSSSPESKGFKHGVLVTGIPPFLSQTLNPEKRLVRPPLSCIAV